MRRLLPFLCLFYVLSLAAAPSPLAEHPSPYLSMHADDPVAWRLWDPSLLEQAREKGQPLFISSGYFACHWCHVMQSESFRNNAIARRLNRDFIPVKIDRELWPELDGYLIEFLERTRGSAGWPLNVIVTPKGDPLVGTTYLPPEQFEQFLARFQQRWVEEAEELTTLAYRAARQSGNADSLGAPATAEKLRAELRSALLAAWSEQADLLSGGIGEQSKFPDYPLLAALMPLADAHPELSDFLLLTLKQMSSEGLRDHLGGGFFRYTVDPGWQQPHFEKMLIDNAQLARLYLLAERRWPGQGFGLVAQGTLDFLLREMEHPQGGFISALSAIDDKGVEGGYYLWSDQQLSDALGEDGAARAAAIWDMQGAAPWPEGHLPIERNGPLTEDGTRQVETLRKKLLAARGMRSLPRDTKRLAAANGSVLVTLSILAVEVPRFQNAAKRARNYLHSLWDGERLWRMRDESGELHRHGGLEDYTQVAYGLLQWSMVSGDEESRKLAVELIQTAWRQFYQDGWRLLPLAPPRAMVPDGVSPSPVSVLFEVNRLLGDDAPLATEQLERVLLSAPDRLKQEPFEYASYLSAISRLSRKSE